MKKNPALEAGFFSIEESTTKFRREANIQIPLQEILSPVQLLSAERNVAHV
jgi:hypothetical protein